MKIVVFGAGSIGCYVGGRLIANGEEVILYGRENFKNTIEQHGLTLTHYELQTDYVSASKVQFSVDPKCLEAADLILLTVKSQDTSNALTTIKQFASHKAVIVSLQNGVKNPEVIRTECPTYKSAGGMVPFNVVNKGDGHFHCGTEGYLVFEKNYETGLLTAKCNAAGMPAKLTENISGVLWGKLLLNLNNALNMLSDKPLKEELADRNYRRVLARCITEALAVLDAANIKPEQIGKSPPRLLAKILSLPDFAFQAIAKGMLKIDPEARSSMWEDLQAKRKPEIDFLNGAIIELAEAHGMSAPINRFIVSLVKQAFENGVSPGLGGEKMLADVEALN